MRTLRSLLAVFALATIGPAARADLLYSWSNPTGPTYASGTGSISVVPAPDGVGSSSIPVASYFASSSASAGSPDIYNQPYTLVLHLTDKASNASGDLHFLASISGSATASNYALQNTFAAPSQQITLGGLTYTVSLTPSSSSLAGPRLMDFYDVHANVRVQSSLPNNPPPPVHNTPEPGSLILAGIAVCLAGGRTLRRARCVPA